MLAVMQTTAYLPHSRKHHLTLVRDLHVRHPCLDVANRAGHVLDLIPNNPWIHVARISENTLIGEPSRKKAVPLFDKLLAECSVGRGVDHERIQSRLEALKLVLDPLVALRAHGQTICTVGVRAVPLVELGEAHDTIHSRIRTVVIPGERLLRVLRGCVLILPGSVDHHGGILLLFKLEAIVALNIHRIGEWQAFARVELRTRCQPSR